MTSLRWAEHDEVAVVGTRHPAFVVWPALVLVAAAAVVGASWPADGVVVFAAVLVVVVHLGAAQSRVGAVARSLTAVPALGLSRFALPVDVIAPMWWSAMVVVPAAWIAVRSGAWRSGSHRRADVFLVAVAAAAAAVVTGSWVTMAAWNGKAAAAGAVAGAAVLGLVAAATSDAIARVIVRPVVSAPICGLFVLCATGAASVGEALIVGVVASAAAFHARAGGHVVTRLLTGAAVGAVLATSPW